MVEIFKRCKETGVRMLLSIHDELDFSIPKSKKKSVGGEIKQRLETFDGKECEIECRVPIRTSLSYGVNWWEACK